MQTVALNGRWEVQRVGTRDTYPARVPGDGELDVIEDAPGSYVKIQATD